VLTCAKSNLIGANLC